MRRLSCAALRRSCAATVQVSICIGTLRWQPFADTETAAVLRALGGLCKIQDGPCHRWLIVFQQSRGTPRAWFTKRNSEPGTGTPESYESWMKALLSECARSVQEVGHPSRGGCRCFSDPFNPHHLVTQFTQIATPSVLWHALISCTLLKLKFLGYMGGTKSSAAQRPPHCSYRMDSSTGKPVSVLCKGR